MALSILLRRSFVRSSIRSSLHSSSLPSPLPSSLLSVRTFSTPGGAIQDKPSDNTKLFVRALDSDIRGEVDPRDLDLINDQDVMGPLSKKWSSLQSYINNIREHDLTSKSHLKQQSYTALPEGKTLSHCERLQRRSLTTTKKERSLLADNAQPFVLTRRFASSLRAFVARSLQRISSQRVCRSLTYKPCYRITCTTNPRIRSR